MIWNSECLCVDDLLPYVFSMCSSHWHNQKRNRFFVMDSRYGGISDLYSMGNVGCSLSDWKPACGIKAEEDYDRIEGIGGPANMTVSRF